MDGRAGAGVINLVGLCRLGVPSPTVALRFRRYFGRLPGGGGDAREGRARGWDISATVTWPAVDGVGNRGLDSLADRRASTVGFWLV
jgi:hypothetical protein